MSTRAIWPRAALLLLLAFAFDMAVGQHLTIAGVRPDVTLSALVPISLMAGSQIGTWLGFVAGLLQGSFAGAAIGSLIVSRSLAGWTTGLLDERIYREHVLVPSAACLVIVLGAEIVFYVLNPLPGAATFLARAAGRAVYAAGLAVPISLVCRATLRRREP